MTSTGSKYKPALSYHVLTRWYDAAIAATLPERLIRKKLMDLISPKEGELILEFGCGSGQNLAIGSVRGPRTKWIGIDTDERILKVARKKQALSKEVELMSYNGQKLPFSSSHFDCVFSSLVFHHLESDLKKEALLEIFRVLKPGGRFILADWGLPANRKSRWKFYLVQILDGFKTTEDNVKGTIPSLVERAGFKMLLENDQLETLFGTFRYYTAYRPKTKNRFYYI
ncbi:Methyltransferase domain-containing protein [Cnuella takakiae]|uniref:Methyltransferase domain-containing protein n=1 Tax=Cnuella takakiae TaxID=1302690 RepID=A0A1M4SL05_9BACT|nr:class I SAM-dependent methyltransferase [Cnuella takakiae]OLY94530.1 hypothetical protein BUE76_23645 [Cnuella takakiae]SHE32657.1 Methyltransferase domain-containing protein [Cnuella takakiae]